MFRLDKVQFKIIEGKLDKHNWKRVRAGKVYERFPLPDNHMAYAHTKYYPYRNIIIVWVDSHAEFFLPRNLSWKKLVDVIELGYFPPNKKTF